MAARRRLAAARSGLEGALIDPGTRREAPAAQVVRGLLGRVRPALEAAGDWPTVRDLAERALADGSAAHRIRRTAHHDDLLACTDLAIAETRGEERPRPRRTAPARRVASPGQAAA
ncbi:carboxylate-amine ligase [Streptomyces sp. DconLS]|nr:carboxylate-amine ligase [Streptomyces sp. DconLS]